MNKEDKRVTSEILQDVASGFTEDRITVFAIKDAIKEKGFAIMLLVFSLPLSIPLPVPPGTTTIAALPLLVLSFQAAIGIKSPWLPDFIGQKSLKRTTLAAVVEKSAPFLRKIEKITKPRFSTVAYLLSGKMFGVLVMLCSLSIAVPLPLTNFIPAIGIVLLSLGLLSKDGAIMLLGILVSAFGLLISASVIILGPKVIIALFKKYTGDTINIE